MYSNKSMKHSLRFFLFLFSGVFALLLSSCSDDAVNVDDINKQTVLVFMPWSGSTTNAGLYTYLKQNLDSIESTIKKHKGANGRVLVFLATSPSKASLYEITYSAGALQHNVIKEYSGNSYDTTEGMAEVFNDVQRNAYALNYALIIGGHGTGWTFKSSWGNSGSLAKNHGHGTPSQTEPQSHDALPSFTNTRFFGSSSDMDYAFDIPDLAAALQQTGMKTQYILFDDCYMANIEVAYELKDVTNYLIASTSEVMAVGMPYASVWDHLNRSAPDYKSVVDGFYTFYSNYPIPCGALSVIDCRKVDKLAAIMKEINSRNTFSNSLRDSLQVLDGFSPTIFYDLGSYVDHLCQNDNLKSDFHSALDAVVRYKTCTSTLYSNLYGLSSYIPVKTFSGITISDPSLNTVARSGMQNTGWWKATH